MTSRADDEALAGTAPTESAWLFVEYAGAWGRRAVAESRLSEEVRTFLADAGESAGIRVQLIRRHGGVDGPGVRVFAARLGAEQRLWTTLLTDMSDLLELDLAALASGAAPGFTAYDGPLWLVCTNGRRDLCCAELGRPIAGALSARWPEETWETTHLGGHRFAGTLLALPSGIALGRLDAEHAVVACSELESGRVPGDADTVVRGRAGLDGAAQVAELHLRRELGLVGLDEVVVRGSVAGEVTLEAAGDTHMVTVEESRGEPRRQSCADLKVKPGAVYAVASWVRQPAAR